MTPENFEMLEWFGWANLALLSRILYEITRDKFYYFMSLATIIYALRLAFGAL